MCRLDGFGRVSSAAEIFSWNPCCNLSALVHDGILENRAWILLKRPPYFRGDGWEWQGMAKRWSMADGHREAKRVRYLLFETRSGGLEVASANTDEARKGP